MSDPPRRLLLFWYGAAVFLSSALLLVLEIVAGRLLAPYIGVSLYTWTAIIGVILAGLSLGNWLGGRMADRGLGETAAGVTLLLAALASYLILPLLMVVAGRLQASELNLLGASFLYVLALFFSPAVLLGIVTPLLTTLALRLDSRAGHVVGRMHALAALGSIGGTFATGYWLVQTFGTKRVIVGVAVALVLLALPFLRRMRPAGGVAVLVATALLFGGLTLAARGVQGFVDPCDRESSYYCLRVIDETGDSGELAARSLVLDHMMHSTNDRLQPDRLWTPYVHAMDELAVRYFPEGEKLRWFFAGGGAYTHPRALRYRSPLTGITVSEIDPVVTEVARSSLFFDSPDVEILHGDARVMLESLADRKFDVIVTDVFHDVAVPYHLTTLEYGRLVRSRLAGGGLYLLNVVDIFPDAKLVKAMMKTLQPLFEYVEVWIERPPDRPTRLTYVISASDRGFEESRLRSRRGEPRAWFNIAELLHESGTPLAEIPRLTDDFTPVEKLIAPLFASQAGL